MKIEVIDNPRFAEIWVEGEKWKEIHRRLYKGYIKELLRSKSREELQECILRIDGKVARSLVYRWLALRGYMKAELMKKLKAYKIDPEAAEGVLAECEGLGYLDDKREGKLFIAREKRRGMGPKMVALKLGEKDPKLKGMVATSFTEEEERREIKKWIEKKTRRSDISEVKVKQRLYRFLVGKGFTESLVRDHLFVDE